MVKNVHERPPDHFFVHLMYLWLNENLILHIESLFKSTPAAFLKHFVLNGDISLH